MVLEASGLNDTQAHFFHQRSDRGESIPIIVLLSFLRVTFRIAGIALVVVF